MNHPMIAWCMIAGVLLCAFIFRAIEWHFTQNRNGCHKSRHILEIGREKEIFYIPGDTDEEYGSDDL